MKRNDFLNIVKKQFRVHPIVAILGPRQCGKTTLARMFVKEKKQTVTYFDLEDPGDLIQFDTPKLALSSLKGLVVIDEIQRKEDLFPLLRVLVDRPKNKTKFLILGSASRDLLRQSSESLAGRIGFVELTPFTLKETGKISRLWFRGGFPRSYLARSNEDSREWRYSYITTFLERDIPNLGIHIPPNTLRRFWTMLAHYHANIFNFSEFGRSMGTADTTIRRYLDILSGTFMIRQLNPWFENLKKRQVKAPKIYFRDSGIFHSFIGTFSKQELMGHPKLGASWEGFALEEVICFHDAKPEDCFFWATHNGAELDLLIIKYGKRLGFEFKYADAPKLTRSMKIAMDNLQLDSISVIYPEGKTFKLDEKITAIPLESYLK